MFFRKPKTETTVSRTLRTFGLSEEAVREKLAGAGLLLSILSHPKGVDVTLRIDGASGSAALPLLDAAEEAVRKRLGDSVFGSGQDRMEEVVGRMLSEQEKTLSAAESCTGGLICHMLTNIPGSSKYFKQGFVVYDDAAKTKTLGVNPGTLKKYGSVSPQAAAEMAENAKKLSGSDASIAVSGIAGPGGGSPEKPVGTVFMCAVNGKHRKIQEHRFKGWRELVKIQAAQGALDLLRRTLKDSG